MVEFTFDDDDVEENVQDYKSLKLPQYKEDFEYIFSKIGFVNFLRKLKHMNRNLNLTLDIAVTNWKEVMEAKHAEWRRDDICDSEKRDKLAQALLSVRVLRHRIRYSGVY